MEGQDVREETGKYGKKGKSFVDEINNQPFTKEDIEQAFNDLTISSIQSSKFNDINNSAFTRLKKKFEEKVFLKQGYSVHDLAKDSGIPHYLLSQFINQNLGVSFPDYINKARVIHSCELLELAQTENYTLEAIGQLSGFSNRNSFSSAFKKVIGKSPSVYLKDKTTRLK